MNENYLEMTELLENVRRTGIMPFTTHTIVSAWMPSMFLGHLAESAFLYYGPSRETAMSRPYAWFTVDSRTGALVRFEYCVNADFVNTDEHPFDEKLETRKLPVKERSAIGRAFAEAYENCRGFLFADPAELTEEQTAKVVELKEAMEQAIEPSLMPFYQGLGEEFFSWVEKVCEK